MALQESETLSPRETAYDADEYICTQGTNADDNGNPPMRTCVEGIFIYTTAISSQTSTLEKFHFGLRQTVA